MHRTAVRTATLACAAVLLSSLVVAPAVAGGPPVAFPSRPKGLTSAKATPSPIDPAARYQGQVSCQPISTRPGVAKLRSLVLRTYGVGRAGRTTGPCTEGVSEHADGRAWDWMVDVTDKKEKAAAADFLAWLTRDGGRNARRLGVMYVIYNEKIWGVYRASDGWRPSAGHRDHVHVSLSWNGARGTTSFWTGKVHATDHGPCTIFSGQYAPVTRRANTAGCASPASLPRSTSHASRPFGARAAEVGWAQSKLDVPRTEVVDARTRTAVMAYQRDHDLPETGVLDENTWASLDPGSVDKSAVKGMTAASALRYGRAHYQRTTLRRGSAGKAVLVLQRGLGMPRQSWSGWFGPGTEAALKRAQTDVGRPATGTATGADWTALAG